MSLVGSSMRLPTWAGSFGSSVNHQSSACVSRSRRTGSRLSLADLVRIPVLVERVGDHQSSFPRASAGARGAGWRLGLTRWHQAQALSVDDDDNLLAVEGLGGK